MKVARILFVLGVIITTPVLSLFSKEMGDILDKSIPKNRKFKTTLLLSLANIHYRYMSRHVVDNLIFVPFSPEMVPFVQNLVCSFLENGGDVSLLLLSIDGECSQIDTRESLRIECVSYQVNNERAENGVVVYQKGTYLKLVAQKLAFTCVVFEVAKKIGFRKMALSDADVIYLGNPFSAYDCTVDVCFMNGAVGTRDGCASGDVINSGFYIMKMSDVVYSMLTKAVDNLRKGITYDNTDQGAITSAILGMRGVLTYEILSCRMFANGAVFLMNQESLPGLVVVHMNWILSSEDKKRCFKSTGLWFTSEQTCSPAGERKTTMIKKDNNGPLVCV